MTIGIRRRLIAGTCVLAIGLSACGSDDDTASKKETTTTTETRPKVSAEFQDYCDVAWDIFEQDGPPDAEQLQGLLDNAPDEISAQVNVAAPPLIAAGTDTVAFFNAFAADEVEAAVAQADAWEKENCKIPHEDRGAGEGATREVDPAAARVDVAMTEYQFDFAEPVTAGPRSFVATSNGAQAHFLLLVKLAEGATLDQALKSNDDSMIEGQWISGLSAAGGTDEEALTVDLEPGTYGMACFVSDPDGTPHAMKGMVKEFTVT